MMAYSTIQLSLVDELLREVVDEETAACLWWRLDSLTIRSPSLWLFILHMKEGNPINEHLVELNKILWTKIIGVKSEEVDQTLIYYIHFMLFLRMLLTSSFMVEIIFL